MPQSRRLRPERCGRSDRITTPPHDCRSRGDCGEPAFREIDFTGTRLTIAAVAATAAASIRIDFFVHLPASRLPQSRRLRLEGTRKPLCRMPTASRLPQSRRLRHQIGMRSTGRDGDPPHDCRSRGDCGRLRRGAFSSGNEPPHDCRSRGDCGCHVLRPLQQCVLRLTIAAVAATAAPKSGMISTGWPAASRLPQSRRLRLFAVASSPAITHRLTIAAVAATAATSRF